MKAITSALFFAFVLLAVPSRADVDVYSNEMSYLPGQAHRVNVNLGFGELQVEGIDESKITVEIRVTCSRQDFEKCKRRGERIRLVPRIKNGKFLIGLKHTPQGKVQGLNAYVKLHVPKGLPLDVDMVGGDVFVSEMLADVAVAGGGGDVDVVARHDLTGNVNMKVVAGHAELWMGDGHMKGGGFPRAIRWRGPGASRIDIQLGTGDARVRLE